MQWVVTLLSWTFCSTPLKLTCRSQIKAYSKFEINPNFQVLWNIAWKCVHQYCLRVWIHVHTSAALSVSALTASRAPSRSTRYFWSCSKCQSQSENRRKGQRLSVSQTHRVSKASLCAARGWIENHNGKKKKGPSLSIWNVLFRWNKKRCDKIDSEKCNL